MRLTVSQNFCSAAHFNTSTLNAVTRQRRWYSNRAVAGGVNDPITYCRNSVQGYDYEGWLCSYFYPSTAKASYFALKAFFVCILSPIRAKFDLTILQNELAMIPDTVSNVTIAQMRLQFWKDAIASFSNPNVRYIK